MKTTLPTDSNERKEYPIYEGFLLYFPAAIAGAARHSKLGNDKHNPGQTLHHARGKSADHASCIIRHLMDLGDLIAAYDRDTTKEMFVEEPISPAILAEANALFWRAGALSQELHERFGAPLAPGARLPAPRDQLQAAGQKALAEDVKSVAGQIHGLNGLIPPLECGQVEALAEKGLGRAPQDVRYGCNTYGCMYFKGHPGPCCFPKRTNYDDIG